MKLSRIPKTRESSIAWHAYSLRLAAECRKVGYKSEAAKYLQDCRYARWNIQHFLPDNNMPL